MTNPDSLAKVITEMRHSATWEDNVDAAIADELADRIERLDAEKSSELTACKLLLKEARAQGFLPALPDQSVLSSCDPKSAPAQSNPTLPAFYKRIKAAVDMGGIPEDHYTRAVQNLSNPPIAITEFVVSVRWPQRN